MNDAQRELYIREHGRLMLIAMERFEVTGCLADRGDADKHRLAMEQAIKERSPEQVARMEIERGIQ